MEWTVAIEGKNERGEIFRREVRIDKNDERLRDGDLGLSIDDGKKIMATLQAAVVTHEVEAYTLFRRVCPDCHTLRPVKDYTTRRLRTVSARWKFAIPAGCCAGIATQEWTPRLRR